MPAPNVPQNTLSILVNEPTHITFGPYSIEATPITVGELPAVLRHAGPIIEAVQSISTIEDAIALFAAHGDALIEITALAARLPIEQVRALTPDLAAELFIGLLELNSDFFARRMGPGLLRAGEILGRVGEPAAPQATSSTGPTSSPAS